MMQEWPTLALFWYAPPPANTVADPIFGKPLNFFLFTLPAWHLIIGWLLTLSVIACILAVLFLLITSGSRALNKGNSRYFASASPWRGLSLATSALLLLLAINLYVDRFDRLFDHHTIFEGVTYTDAHITLTGLLVVCVALILGAGIAAYNAVRNPRAGLLAFAIVPAAVCYVVLGIVGWYVSNFVVKPNELVREAAVHRPQH